MQHTCPITQEPIPDGAAVFEHAGQVFEASSLHAYLLRCPYATNPITRHTFTEADLCRLQEAVPGAPLLASRTEAEACMAADHRTSSVVAFLTNMALKKVQRLAQVWGGADAPLFYRRFMSLQDTMFQIKADVLALRNGDTEWDLLQKVVFEGTAAALNPPEAGQRALQGLRTCLSSVFLMPSPGSTFSDYDSDSDDSSSEEDSDDDDEEDDDDDDGDHYMQVEIDGTEEQAAQGGGWNVSDFVRMIQTDGAGDANAEAECETEQAPMNANPTEPAANAVAPPYTALSSAVQLALSTATVTMLNEAHAAACLQQAPRPSEANTAAGMVHMVCGVMLQDGRFAVVSNPPQHPL